MSLALNVAYRYLLPVGLFFKILRYFLQFYLQLNEQAINNGINLH